MLKEHKESRVGKETVMTMLVLNCFMLRLRRARATTLLSELANQCDTQIVWVPSQRLRDQSWSQNLTEQK
jgi:hypothetical protein